MDKNTLISVAQKVMQKGKGILAADESLNTIQKRFDSIHIENTEDNRCSYRHLLFSTTEAMKNSISGVILFDETIRQSTSDRKKLVDIIIANDSIPGIKVDQGLKPTRDNSVETITIGLDGLDERFKEYRDLGAQFAKWRAVIHINDSSNLPSSSAVKDNMHALALYARCAQGNNIVPIVEPEILMDGTHDIDKCYEVTTYVLKTLYEELANENVLLEGTILKPNMVIAASQCPKQASIEEVAQKTFLCLSHSVPKDIAGIAFLSGGQSEIEATAHLNAINQIASAHAQKQTWPISFSYGRALQKTVLETWQGKEENVITAREAFIHRAHMNSLAAQGLWNQELEN